MCGHLALKGLSDVFPTSKGKIKLPLPNPLQAMLCRYIELPVENKKKPTLNGGEGEGVWIVLSSEVTPFRTMSQQFCR